MTDNDERLINEREHGKMVAQRGEAIWNWSSPAGRVRWLRRCSLFKEFLGNSRKRVLEIGCGTGLFTKEICGTDNDIIAIDIAEDLIELARRRVSRENVTFIVDNAYKTTFEDTSFDFIVGSSSLHHLDVTQALGEMYRLLKPGGLFMFTEPNMMNPQIALQKNIPFLKKMAGDSPDETAFFRFSLERQLRETGFLDISIVPFDFVHPAIPGSMLSSLVPVLSLLERVPVLKEIAGSLIIRGRK